MNITLASQSPRRRMLLENLGLRFNQISCDVDESTAPTNDVLTHVTWLSEAKAQAGAEQTGSGLVIGADTVVVLDDEILGKPESPDDAVAMLTRLSGRVHRVYTGVTLIEIGAGRITDVECTKVRFLDLEPWEIEAYVATGSPLDKAGAYGIQDRGGLFISGIEGDYNNVVGFPLTRFYYMWRNLCGDERVKEALNGRNII